jgi:hypothetical protein
VVIQERAYRHLGSTVARVLQLAIDACRRRASTLGELHEALRFPRDLPLMDPDRPVVASELIRYARPDILIERGRPRILELNNSTSLGGSMVTPRLAEKFAQFCPQAGLYPPPSTVPARSAALVRTLGGEVGHDHPRRLLIPSLWWIDRAGQLRRKKAKARIVADARRVGFEVVQADLADLHLDAAGRLLAADVPIDLVLIHWGCGVRIVDDGDGLVALRGADRAGTVELFPRTESVLISSKAILAWLHQDCDAGLLASGDHDVVRNYVPRTVCLGLNGDRLAPDNPPEAAAAERDRLIVKPSLDKQGNRVLFGSQTSEQDWLAATVHAAREAPVVLQQRVEPDRIAMPFLDQESGQQVTARVPLVLSPFMIDCTAASVAVRHMSPDVPLGDVVISANRGACESTALLTDDSGPPRADSEASFG